MSKKTNEEIQGTKLGTAELEQEDKPVTAFQLNGVDDATLQKAYNNEFTASDEVNKAQAESNNALSHLGSLTNKTEIVDQSTWDTMNSTFKTPTAVTEADAFLSSQLSKIQSGKTSYSDQVKDMISKIQGREKFSYDVDNDPLFQQALASAMNSGKTAMQDTIGQASALTGGYGSTYATTAGNQQYNAFVEDAYNNLPQYYQMAFDAYQAEGDEMYRQLGMLSDADDREFNRTLTAYDATYQHRNQLYNEAYSQFRDSKTDAYNTANLKMNEHGQLVSDAYNYYNASSNYADTLYNREYNKWADEVNQAMQYAQMQNSDWWAQTNFDEGVRQYEKNFAEQQRQYNQSFAESQRQFNATMAYNKSNGGSGSGSGSGGGTYSLTDTEIKTANEIYSKNGGGAKGEEAVLDYLEQKGKYPQSPEELAIVQNIYKNSNPWEFSTITKSVDTMNGFLGLGNLIGHIDTNDEYTVDGKTYTASQLKEEMKKSGMPDNEIDEIMKSINALNEGGTYNYYQKKSK